LGVFLCAINLFTLIIAFANKLLQFLNKSISIVVTIPTFTHLKINTMGNLLYLVAVVLVILWVIGFLFHGFGDVGNIIHVLLVIAVIAILLKVIGRAA